MSVYEALVNGQEIDIDCTASYLTIKNFKKGPQGLFASDEQKTIGMSTFIHEATEDQLF